MANEDLTLKLKLDVEPADDSQIESTLNRQQKNLDKLAKKLGKRTSEKINEGVNEGLKRNRKRVKKSVDDNIGKQIESTLRGRIQRSLDFAFGALIAKATSRAAFAIKEAFSQAVKTTIQFERGIAEVNSILDENQKLTNEARNSILAFSAQFGTSQQKQVRSFYNIVSAGVKGTTNQLSVLSTANKAAVAGLVDIDTAAFALVSSVNAYSTAGLTAARASDILFRGVKEGQLVFRDLASNLGRVAPIGFQLGLSFSEVVGSISAITRQGLPAAEAASALRQLFSTILGPSAQAKTAINELNAEIQANIDKQVQLGNITAQEGIAKANKEIVNFSKAGVAAAGGISPFLANLTKQLKGNSEALNVLFKNIRAFTAVAAATSNVKQFDDILASVQNSTGATELAFAQLSNTLDFKLKKSVSVIKSVGTVILQSFLPPAKAVADFFLENFAPALLTSFDLVLAVLPGLELAFNGLVGSVKFLFNSLKVTIFGVLQGVTSTLASFIDGIGFLSPSLREKLGGIQSVLRDSSSTFGGVVDESLQGVRDSFDNTFDFALSSAAVDQKANLEKILLNQDQFTEKMKQKLKELFEAQKKAGKSQSDALKDQNRALNQALGSGISSTIQGLAAAIAQGEDVISVFTKNILGTLGDMAIKVGEVVIATALAELALISSPFAGLAAGAGLIAIGAILKQLSGGEGGLEGGGGGGVAAGGFGPGGQLIPQEAEPDDLQPQTVVNLNVEGSIFDGDNTARRLADLLNAGFESENITLKQGF